MISRLLLVLCYLGASACLCAARSPFWARPAVQAVGVQRGTPREARATAAAIPSKADLQKTAAWEKGNQKWDTGVFLRAMVETQRDQIKFEVNKLRSMVPTGIVCLKRSPYEVGKATGILLLNTAGSYAQSAAMGYAFGVIGFAGADQATKDATRRFFPGRAFHVRGVKQAKQFGEFCALFTLFEGGLNVIRGVEDKWNSVVGATGVGLFTARRKSLKGMLLNGVTFGGFNYAITLFDMGEKKNGEEERAALTKEKGAVGRKRKVPRKK